MAELFFGSDNHAGVCPEVMDALHHSNCGRALPYGDDDQSALLDKTYSEIFERDTFIIPVPTGTAANALALSAITPPFGQIFCHEQAHIFTTEAGAPEFYSGGSRLVGVTGANGKVSSSSFLPDLQWHMRPSRHHYLSSCISLTQATEFGTIYSLDELAHLVGIAKAAGLRTHMDGARFANALVALDTTPAKMTWQLGFDVLSLGTTKNGTMNAEAVVTFDKAIAMELAIRQKRAGLLTSKARYLSVQLLAIVANELWLTNARKANSAAQAVAKLLGAVEGVRFAYPVESNQIFVRLPPSLIESLAAHGITFRRWSAHDPDLYRLVMSFDDQQNVQRLTAALSGFSCLNRAAL